MELDDWVTDGGLESDWFIAEALGGHLIVPGFNDTALGAEGRVAFIATTARADAGGVIVIPEWDLVAAHIEGFHGIVSLLVEGGV